MSVTNTYTVGDSKPLCRFGKFDRRGIKVISLSTKIKNYDEILSSLFREIRENLEKKVTSEGTSTSEEASLNLNLPDNIQTMLCFFSIPTKLITYYQTYLFPIVEKFGFQPITTNDIILDSNIYLKVSGLIRKSSIVIADLSSDFVRHAVFLAETEKKPIIVITQGKEDTVLTKIDVIEKDILMRPRYPDSPDDKFKKNLSLP